VDLSFRGIKDHVAREASFNLPAGRLCCCCHKHALCAELLFLVRIVPIRSFDGVPLPNYERQSQSSYAMRTIVIPLSIMRTFIKLCP
jgi:hypothetical protein